jgi:hypothetical protein
LVKILGFELNRASQEVPEPNLIPSIVPPANDDGSSVVIAGGTQAALLDMDGAVRTEADLVMRYREAALHPEVERSIDDIINEIVVTDADTPPVRIDLSDLDLPENFKQIIQEEFANILKMLNFNNKAYEIIKHWYVDGRLYYIIIIDEEDPQQGALTFRYVDPMNLRKVREIIDTPGKDGFKEIQVVNEYYVYQEGGFRSTAGASTWSMTNNTMNTVKIAKDSICYVTSGLQDHGTNMVLSYLNAAIKPLNQLRMLEDASIIYRLVRSPERRMFSVDTGGLPRGKAEQYVNSLMQKHKNRVTYDQCLAMDTLVPLLDGRTLTIEQISAEFAEGKKLWAYSADPETGKFAPGLITSANRTRTNEKVMKVTFDNDKSVTCTYDHKFPVWKKGKVEAKDLQVGDSMVPFYTREKPISSSKTSYHQLYDHVSEKWKYTHRLVSEWKDDVKLPNEYLFNQLNEEKPKLTVHHQNYNRYDNSPFNLTRMNRDDHFDYHKQHNGLAGKKGGIVSGNRHYQNGTGIFALTKEQRSEIGRRVGLIVGPMVRDTKKGIHGLTNQQTKENSRKGTERLQELMSDPDFRNAKTAKTKSSWTKELRAEAAERGKMRSNEHFKAMNRAGHAAKWIGENREESLRKHLERFTIKYDPLAIEMVEAGAKQQLQAKEIVQQLNQYQFDRTMIHQDVVRIAKAQGFSGWREYSNSFKFHNHKIIKIEYLNETIDVGTLGIDRDEVYHNYHTFAIDAGVYTCNSTGQIRGEAKYLTMLEDYWFPNQNGRGTTVTNLPGSGNFMELDDIEYFKRKLYEALKIPSSRTEAGSAFNMGRPSEITRDEIKFMKFVARLRTQFSQLFYKLLSTQLILKQIVSGEEWAQLESKIKFIFTEDNFFEELKQSEILQNRAGTMAAIDPYLGVYFSRQWASRVIWKLTEEEAEEMQQEIEADAAFFEQRAEQGMQEGIEEPDGVELLDPEAAKAFIKRNPK